MAMIAVLGLTVGITLRIVLWRSELGNLDADEAVWGLMAKHALHGDVSTFYWGQAYGGTQEVLLTAPLVWLFGLDVVVIRLVPIGLTAIAAVIVWRIGLRTSGPTSAVAAAVLFWVAPAYVLWKTNRAHGFYGSGLVLTCLILLLVLRLAERRSRADAAALGFVLGLAWWETAQVVAVAVPALGWLVIQRRGVLRDGWLIVAAGLVGAIPWLYSNLRHDWWSFTGPASESVQDLHHYVEHLRVFVDVHILVNLNLRAPFSLAWSIPRPATALVYVALIGAFAWLGWTHRREPVSLLVVVFLAYPLIYAYSGAVWISDEPRYVVLLTPIVALLLGWPLWTPTRAFLGCGIAAALSAIVLVNMTAPGYQARADGANQPIHYAPLLRFLSKHDVDHVVSDYWVAYTIDFLSDERIIAGQGEMDDLVDNHGRLFPSAASGSRHWAYYDAAKASPRTALVYAQTNRSERAQRRALLRSGYTRTTVGSFVVYLPASPTRRSSTATPAQID